MRMTDLQFQQVCHSLRGQYFPEMVGCFRRLEQSVHLNFELSEVCESYMFGLENSLMENEHTHACAHKSEEKISVIATAI